MMEELLNKPYWVIDFLPRQVPAKGSGQFFAVEEYYLRSPMRRCFAEILLKLNCYYDIEVCEPETEKWQKNPPPEALFSWIADNEKDLCVLLPRENALITANRDDLYMTVYAPSEELLQLLRSLAAASGLFLWQPPREE